MWYILAPEMIFFINTFQVTHNRWLTIRHCGVDYTKSELFVEVMKHYIRCWNSKDNSSLPNLDKYQSHLSIEVIDVAMDKWIIMLTLPPTHTHISKKLHSPYVGLFSPFIQHYHSALNSKILHTKAILIVVHHWQNPLESTKGIHFQQIM
jgi:hypothetical protein